MSATLIARLKGEQLNAIAEQRSRAEAIEAEGREVNAEDRAAWAKADEAYDARQAHIDELVKLEAREAAYRDHVATLDGAPSVDEVRHNEADVLRKMNRGELREFDFAPTGGVESRDANTTLSAGVGGNVVPTSFYAHLFVAMRQLSAVMAAEAFVMNTSGGEPMQLPMSDAFPAASLLTEAAAIGASNPTFLQTTIGAYKFGHLSQISSELISDSGVDVVGYLAQKGGEALGHGVGGYLITGAGTAEPTGIIGTAGFASVASATGSAAAGFKYDDVITLYHSIIRPYRDAASFICNDAVIKTLRKLKDSQGRYLWQPALTAGEPDLLGGRPVHTDPAMPSATTNGVKGLAFGNWNRGVAVRIAGGARVESSVDYAFNSDMVTWRFITRADARIVDTNAARVLTYTT